MKSEARTSGRTSSNPNMSITDLIMSYWPWCGLYSPDWLYVLKIHKLLICFKSESRILKWCRSWIGYRLFCLNSKGAFFSNISTYTCEHLHSPSFWVTSNCLWILCLFIENVPAELRDPFYCDQYEQEHLKPPVTRLLQSSELYCRTYSLLLEQPDIGEQPKDNAALVHLLSQRGVLFKDQDTAVTVADLQQKPIKMVRMWEPTLFNYNLLIMLLYHIWRSGCWLVNAIV